MIKQFYWNIEVIKFIFWIQFNLLGYFFTKMVLYSSDLDHYDKNDQQTVIHLIGNIQLSMVQFYFGNIVNRIHLHNPLQILYSFILYLSITMFVYLGQVESLKTSISISSMQTWPIGSYIVYSSTALFILAGLIYHVYLAYKDMILVYYISSFLCILGFYTLTYFILAKNNPYEVLHIHHWFIGFNLCFFFRFDNIVSNIYYCILYGMFLHGTITYGHYSIYQS
jgi:hypothetical protein